LAATGLNMLKRIPFMASINGTLVLLGLIIVFHLLVVFQIIPFTIVWGGRLKNVTEMLRFEMASVFINAFLMATIATKSRYINFNISPKLIAIVLWLFIGLFFLNTIGNLLAKMTFETIVFTPLTFILAILCLRIVMEPTGNAKQ